MIGLKPRAQGKPGQRAFLKRRQQMKLIPLIGKGVVTAFLLVEICADSEDTNFKYSSSISPSDPEDDKEKSYKGVGTQ